MSSAVKSYSQTREKRNEIDKQKKVEEERLARARAIAVQHALSIEEKKNLQNKVLDMILTAYDLPSVDPADPANPNIEDVKTFLQCLAVFRPSDLVELVLERNIDDRCGYALCRRPILKQKPKQVWDARGRLVEKKMDGQWCSEGCRERNSFVKRQLSEEPVWLRQDQSQRILLLMDSPLPPEDVPSITITQAKTHSHKQEELARERGETLPTCAEDITIIEKQETKAPKAPRIVNNDILEGLPVRNIGAIRKRES